MKYKLALFFLFTFVVQASSQELPTSINQYKFSIKKWIEPTAVKNQNRSGTCWIYSAHSFLESEMMRMGKKAIDLSEMHISRAGYIERGELYIRRQGQSSFGQGAENGDVFSIIKKYGLVPEAVYRGLPDGHDKPVHGEVEAVLKGMLDNMLKLPDGKLNPNWKKAFVGAVDGYFGAPPEVFEFEGKNYTPHSFLASTGINPDDYYAITSFSHHPFYKPFILEVADNWGQNLFYNVPLDELKIITDHALDKGYTVMWATDVSEKTFSKEYNIAVNPYQNWEDMDQATRDSLWMAPQPEKMVTQEERQKSFDLLQTTDDHAMHIVGYATDQLDNRYYIVKNSWGTTNKYTRGYIFASDAYFRHKTTSIMLHKDAIPKDIRRKLGI